MATNIGENPFVYSDVFGGANIYPSDITYAQVNLNSDIVYNWPLESAPGINNLLPKILEVTCQSYKAISLGGYSPYNVDPNHPVTPGQAMVFLVSISGLSSGQFVTFGPLSSATNTLVQYKIASVSTTDQSITLTSNISAGSPSYAVLYLYNYTLVNPAGASATIL